MFPRTISSVVLSFVVAAALVGCGKRVKYGPRELLLKLRFWRNLFRWTASWRDVIKFVASLWLTITIEGGEGNVPKPKISSNMISFRAGPYTYLYIFYCCLLLWIAGIQYMDQEVRVRGWMFQSGFTNDYYKMLYCNHLPASCSSPSPNCVYGSWRA